MDSHWPILGHMALNKTKCTPIVIHYLTWSRHGGKCRDRRWEKHCQFSFSWMNTTTQTWNLKLKSNDNQSYPRRETAASGRKRYRHNIRKVLCKSFTQWFCELYLCSYKYVTESTVLIRSAKAYSFVAVEIRWIESLEI